jgi:hypothetical protein
MKGVENADSLFDHYIVESIEGFAIQIVKCRIANPPILLPNCKFGRAETSPRLQRGF